MQFSVETWLFSWSACELLSETGFPPLLSLVWKGEETPLRLLASGILEWNFSFSLCAAPEFEVLVFQIYVVIWNLSERNEGPMHQCDNTKSV